MHIIIMCRWCHLPCDSPLPAIVHPAWRCSKAQCPNVCHCGITDVHGNPHNWDSIWSHSEIWLQSCIWYRFDLVRNMWL